ncbi:MAG: hypothetical protein ABIG20_04655 [archaeon]
MEMKEQIKNFLMPDLKRVVLFSLISLGMYIIAFHIFKGYLATYGYPLPFGYAKTVPGSIFAGPLYIAWSIPNILANLLIYYLIACLFSFAYENLRGSK